MRDDPTSLRLRAARVRAIADRKIRLEPILAIISRRRIGLLLGLGVLLRVARVVAGISPSMDEGSLSHNILARPLSGLFAGLSQTQLAPAGFLVVEWVVSRTLGPESMALRLVPLIGAIASLFLFLAVARQCLAPGAVWIALAIFALTDDLIAYGAQIKQYSTDVAISLLITWLGFRCDADRENRFRLLALAAAGLIVVWFSHPAAFVLAGVGGSRIIGAILRKKPGEAFLLIAISAIWALSFGLVYAISLDQLGHRRDMWAFWNFAFPPIPPRSVADLAWPIRRFLYLFLNPLSFNTPLGPMLSVLPPLLFFSVGAHFLWRRDRGHFLMLASPCLITAVAAALRLYPFHGRLILFLVPFLILPIAEGAFQISLRVSGRALRILLLSTILLFPTLGALSRLIDPYVLQEFNPLGDLRPRTLNPIDFPFQPARTKTPPSS